MDAFFLNFHSRELERQYGELSVRRVYWQTDARFLLVGFLLLSISTVKSIFERGRGGTGNVALGASWIGLLALHAARRRMGVEGFAIWRPRIVAAFRVWMTLCLAISDSNFSWMVEPPLPNSTMGILFAFSCIEVISTIGAGIFMPLAFKHHLYTQLATTLIVLFSKTPAFCSCAVKYPGGQPFLNVEEGLSKLSSRILKSIDYRFATNSIRIVDKVPCLHFAVFVHICLGFGLVSYMVWMAEWEKRLTFLKSVENGDSISGWLCSSSKDRSMWVRHSILLLLSFALGWEFLFWVPRLIQYSTVSTDC